MRYVTALALTALLAGLGLLLAERPATAQGGDKGWGTVKGRIVWGGGEIPPNPVANVQGNMDAKHCLQNGDVHTDEWVIDPKTKGIRWTFVWLAPDNGGNLPIHPLLEKIKEEKVVIDQPSCRFEPHALGMRKGQILVARNSAPVNHNFRWSGHPLKNPGGNVVIPAGKSYEIKDLKLDKLPISVGCDFHKWMNAKVRIFDHPYFAVTKEDGSFEIKQAPAGKYRLMVWHESVGWRGGESGANGQEITIKGGTDNDVGNLDLKK